VNRTRRGVAPVVRLALLAQGVYLLVISTVPFLRLWAAPPGVVDHGQLLLQFVLWSVVPAVALLVASWVVGRPLDPVSQRAVRAAAIMATAYLALGGVISLVDPSTTPAGTTIAIAVLIAGAIGAVGLARLTPRPTAGAALAGAYVPQGSSSRSATTIR
jgi:hypothetical protein